jgi:myo-inositol-1-phosphate synthase
MKSIKVAVVGLGNCASALIQGINYYRENDLASASGLMHPDIGGYKPWDIEIAAAFDIDRRKVGKDVNIAMFSEPNCTTIFYPHIRNTGVIVKMGHIGDGISEHMKNYPATQTFMPADVPELTKDEIVEALRESRTEILLNYLPVGSDEATKFYAECALEAGIGLVNNIPVFIASDPIWAARFEKKKIPIIGDDIKSQLGATILHRAIADLFKKRGVKLTRTYQLNTGGNTDFLNMLNRRRLMLKKESKTEALQAVMAERLSANDIHVGPSDYVPWLKDNKVAFIRIEGDIFGDVPINLEIRLSVEDSPNSAGVVVDAIRCCKLALSRGIGGPIYSVSSYFMKHPPKQFPDDEAFSLTEDFISGKSNY